MACLSLGFLYQLCVWLIIVAAVYAILQLLLPYLGGILPDIVVQIIRIIIWAIIALAVLFMLLSCLVGGGGLGGLHFPR